MLRFKEEKNNRLLIWRAAFFGLLLAEKWAFGLHRTLIWAQILDAKLSAKLSEDLAIGRGGCAVLLGQSHIAVTTCFVGKMAIIQALPE